MLEFQLPLLQLAVLLPLTGSVAISRARDPEIARRRTLWVCGLTLACSVSAWVSFFSSGALEAHDSLDLLAALLGYHAIAIDGLNGPLLPMAALLYLVTVFATLRTKARRFPFARTVVSESLLLAMLSCRDPWIIITLLAAQAVPPVLELRDRGSSPRVFVVHMVLLVGLLAGGWGMVEATGRHSAPSIWGIGMLIAAVLLRCGVVPVHCWMTDLFEKATFGTALLYVAPLAGVYAAVRLVLPIAPDGALWSIGLISLVTAIYAAGMALVQIDGRRFLCYVFLSHSSLVLVGFETATPLGLTGALCLWVSVPIALTGFGLTLRSVESRTGPVSLGRFHGLYEHMPLLAAFFLLTGLASIGFPGTIGFVGTELLVEGAVDAYPSLGIAVVIAAALNGIAVMRAYFRLFTGTRHTASISLRVRPPEQIAVLALSSLIVAGGLFPQPGVASRYRAAQQINSHRLGNPTSSHGPIKRLPSRDSN